MSRRRRRHKIAAEDPPSIYAALGGYGPRGANEKLIDPIQKPGAPYAQSIARIVGLRRLRRRRFPDERCRGAYRLSMAAWPIPIPAGGPSTSRCSEAGVHQRSPEILEQRSARCPASRHSHRERKTADRIQVGILWRGYGRQPELAFWSEDEVLNPRSEAGYPSR